MIRELSLRPFQPTFAHSPNFTVLFHASFDFPLPRFNHHHILLKVYHITCCSWLFRVRPSPLFFRLASNAFPDIGSVARIEKKINKNKISQEVSE